MVERGHGRPGDFVVSWTSYGQDGVGNGYGPGVNGTERRLCPPLHQSRPTGPVPVIVNGQPVYTPVTVNGVTVNVPESEPEPEFQVNTIAANNNQHSRVAMDAAGDFSVTWEGYQTTRPPGSNVASPRYGIYAQRYASETAYNADFPNSVPNLGPNGEVGGQFEVNTTTSRQPALPEHRHGRHGRHGVRLERQRPAVRPVRPAGILLPAVPAADGHGRPDRGPGRQPRLHDLGNEKLAVGASRRRFDRPADEVPGRFDESLNTTGLTNGEYSVRTPTTGT